MRLGGYCQERSWVSTWGAWAMAVCVAWASRAWDAEAIALAPIYWSASNSIFKASRNSHIVEVNLDDQIDFVCPYVLPSNDSSTSATPEYYIIYQVTRQGYETCNIFSGPGTQATMIVNCSNPSHPKRYTMLFELFQSIPNAPEFVSGHTYYYITTSSGTVEGLMNAEMGACYYQNLKLVIHVCCDTTTTQGVSSSLFTAPSATSLSPAAAAAAAAAAASAASRAPSQRRTQYIPPVAVDSSKLATTPHASKSDIPEGRSGRRGGINQVTRTPSTRGATKEPFLKQRGLTNCARDERSLACATIVLFKALLVIFASHWFRMDR